MPTVELIVPCFNEEQSLDAFYQETQRVFATLPQYRFSYLFVDDGSGDGTLQALQNLAEKDSAVKYISFSRNFGKEAALYAGLEQSRGDYVGLIDADLQHPPSLIADMLEKLEEGYDCCAARRLSRRGEPFFKRVFSHLFYKLINAMSEIDVVEGAVDFRIMRRQVVDAVLSVSERQRFSKGILTWVGFDTYYLEFENVERAAGQSKWSFRNLLKYAVDGITSFSTVPLRLASILGLIISASSFLYLIGVVMKTLVMGIDVPGYASQITLILFIGGIIILSCGVLGEYIARIFVEVKHRPLYIQKRDNLTISSEDKKDEEHV